MMHAPPPIRVAVNDRQLHVVAVMDHDRVLVPLRAIVDALYGDLRQIRLPLPPPSRIIAGRTYAPVRAIANLLHAHVEYDGRTRIVSVYGTRVAVLPTPSAPVAVGVAGREPSDGERVASAYPTISANLDLPNGATISQLRVLVDGIDVGPYATYDGTYVTYIPRRGLRTGMHTVSISGSTTSGMPFSTAWSFQTTRAPDTDNSGFYGSGYAPLQLLVSGNQFLGGAPVSVQLIAPPGGQAFAFVCTSAWQYELYAAPTSNYYFGSVPTDRVNAPIDCPITAMYVSANGVVTYAPYPEFVQLLPLQTPQPQPTPTPIYRIPGPGPIHRRTPAPIPTATATPAPTPVATHKPIAPPIRRIEPTPVPRRAPLPHPIPVRTVTPPHPAPVRTATPRIVPVRTVLPHPAPRHTAKPEPKLTPKPAPKATPPIT